MLLFFDTSRYSDLGDVTTEGRRRCTKLLRVVSVIYGFVIVQHVTLEPNLCGDAGSSRNVGGPFGRNADATRTSFVDCAPSRSSSCLCTSIFERDSTFAVRCSRFWTDLLTQFLQVSDPVVPAKS